MLAHLREEHYYKVEEKHHREQYFNEKDFHYKESMITEFLNFQNYQTIYNMIVAAAICLAFNLMVNDYFTTGNVIDIGTLLWCFSGMSQIIRPWLVNHLISFLIIPLVQMILKLNLRYYIWLPLHLALQMSILYNGFSAASSIASLGFASKMSILCETVRVVLKTHSYIRNKLLYCRKNPFQIFIPQSWRKQGFKEENLNIPQFSMEDTFTEVGGCPPG